jgi:hypothetical protein
MGPNPSGKIFSVPPLTLGRGCKRRFKFAGSLSRPLVSRHLRKKVPEIPLTGNTKGGIASDGKQTAAIYEHRVVLRLISCRFEAVSRIHRSSLLQRINRGRRILRVCSRHASSWKSAQA